MNDDVLARLHDLGGEVSRLAPSPEDLRRVRRGLVRRRHVRVAGAAGLTAAAVAVVAVVVIPGAVRHADVPPAGPTISVTTPPPSPALSTPGPTAPASTAASGPATGTPAATPDVYVDIPQRASYAGGGPLPDQGDLVEHSGATGAKVRVLAHPNGKPFLSGAVSPSGRYAYVLQQVPTSASTYTVTAARIPVGGGAAQSLTLPTQPPSGQAPVLLASPDDHAMAYATGPSTTTIAATSNGKVLATLPGQVVGWLPDSQHVVVEHVRQLGDSTAQQVPAARLTFQSVDLSSPSTSNPLLTVTSAAPGDDGACGVPSTAAAVSAAGRLVVVTGGCSTQPDGRSQLTFLNTVSPGSPSTMTLPASVDGAFANKVAWTPASTVVVFFTHQDCSTSPPALLVHGAAVTRPSYDGALCPTTA